MRATARAMFLLLAAMLFSCGCSKIQSNITTFHTLTPSTPKTYYIVRLDTQKQSLEHSHYENYLKTKLAQYGYTETKPEEADIAICFSYGNDAGRVVVSTSPVYGQTGVSSATTVGTYNQIGSMGSFTGVTELTPTYGIVGTRTDSSTVFTRYFQMTFYDLNNYRTTNEMKQIYEVKAISEGSKNSFNQVAEEVIDSVFTDFPGESGKTRRVVVKAKD